MKFKEKKFGRKFSGNLLEAAYLEAYLVENCERLV